MTAAPGVAVVIEGTPVIDVPEPVAYVPVTAIGVVLSTPENAINAPAPLVALLPILKIKELASVPSITRYNTVAEWCPAPAS